MVMLSGSRWGVGAVFAAVTFAAGQVEVWTGARLGGVGTVAPGASPLGLAVLVAVATLPLAAVRYRPVGVAVVVGAALVVQVVLVTPSLSLIAGLLPLVVVSFATAAYATRVRAVLGLVVALLVQLTVTLRIPEEREVGEVVFGGFVLAGGWLLGRGVGRRLSRADRAVTDAAMELADQRRAMDQMVSDERDRIARELHDVIAHGVSVMGVQAAAARVLMERDPQRAAASLLAVEQQARDSIGELQRLLGVLRTDDGRGVADPRPGLGRVPHLVDGLREAGMAIDVVVSGIPCRLADGMDLTAYRIVQEALTNAVKHASRAAVRLRLCWTPDRLEIDVRNDGHVSTSWTAGHGLVGMRERVALFGGTFTAGPGPAGGFHVRAVLPFAAGPG